MTQANHRIPMAIGLLIMGPLTIFLAWVSFSPFPSLWTACLTLAAVACVLGFAAGWMMGRLGLSVLVSTPLVLAILAYGNRLPVLYGDGKYDLVNQLFPFIYVLLSILPCLLVSVVLGGFFRARQERSKV